MVTRIGDITRAKIAEAWPAILAELATGALVKSTLAKHGISPQECAAWRLENPDRQKEWETARELSADAFMDEALDIARDPFEMTTRHPETGEELEKPLVTRIDAAHARTRIDTLKWAARIRNPRLYGDKQAIDLNVKTVDLTRIIQDANARLQAARQIGRVVEGAVITQALPRAIEDLI